MFDKLAEAALGAALGLMTGLFLLRVICGA
mgnify:CR=1 FL=1